MKLKLDEETELTEREEKIFDKGVSEGMDIGFIICFILMIIITSIIMIFK